MSTERATAASLPPDGRSQRALTEPLLVFDDLDWAADADGLALVYSADGTEHRVDMDTGACDCDDAFYRGVECKHVRRARLATGRVPLPAWVDDRSAIDSYLRADLEVEA